MNLNVLTYLIYFPIIATITVYTGRVLHRNGQHYIDFLFPDHRELAIRVNNILLLGYYLVNIGDAVLVISFWNKVNSWREVVESLSGVLSILILLLAGLHFLNMTMLYLFHLKISKKNTNSI